MADRVICTPPETPINSPRISLKQENTVAPVQLMLSASVASVSSTDDDSEDLDAESEDETYVDPALMEYDSDAEGNEIIRELARRNELMKNRRKAPLQFSDLSEAEMVGCSFDPDYIDMTLQIDHEQIERMISAYRNSDYHSQREEMLQFGYMPMDTLDTLTEVEFIKVVESFDWEKRIKEQTWLVTAMACYKVAPKGFDLYRRCRDRKAQIKTAEAWRRVKFVELRDQVFIEANQKGSEQFYNLQLIQDMLYQDNLPALGSICDIKHNKPHLELIVQYYVANQRKFSHDWLIAAGLDEEESIAMVNQHRPHLTLSDGCEVMSQRRALYEMHNGLDLDQVRELYFNHPLMLDKDEYTVYHEGWSGVGKLLKTLKFSHLLTKSGSDVCYLWDKYWREIDIEDICTQVLDSTRELLTRMKETNQHRMITDGKVRRFTYYKENNWWSSLKTTARCQGTSSDVTIEEVTNPDPNPTNDNTIEEVTNPAPNTTNDNENPDTRVLLTRKRKQKGKGDKAMSKKAKTDENDLQGCAGDNKALQRLEVLTMMRPMWSRKVETFSMMLADLQGTKAGPIVKLIVKAMRNSSTEKEKNDYNDMNTKHPYLIPLKGGAILELDSLHQRRSTKDDLFSYECPTHYIDPTAPDMTQEDKDQFELVKKYFDRLTRDDRPTSNGEKTKESLDKEQNERKESLLYRTAYGFTGETNIKEATVLHGPGGNNGKSSYAALLTAIGGSTLVYNMPASALTTRENDAATQSSWKMQLRVARIGIIPEPRAGDRINDQTAKILTGGCDSISARECHEKQGKPFVPQTKIFVPSNFFLNTANHDHHTINRLNIQAMLAQFDPNNAESVQFMKEIMNAKDYVFSFIVQYCKKFYKDGKVFPVFETVKQYKADLLDNRDPVRGFLDCFEQSRDQETTFSQMKESINLWNLYQQKYKEKVVSTDVSERLIQLFGDSKRRLSKQDQQAPENKIKKRFWTGIAPVMKDGWWEKMQVDEVKLAVVEKEHNKIVEEFKKKGCK